IARRHMRAPPPYNRGMPHHLDRKLLVALAASVLVGIVFWRSPVLWPFKLLTVLMHESGHAFATLLVGGSVDSISVSANEAGLTWSRYAPTLLRRVTVSSAG